MKPAVQWPLHPAPMDGEALSSWLRRIAFVYDRWAFALFGGLI